jgi:hypothetical protein
MAQGTDRAGGVTRRAILIALLLLVGLSPVAFLLDILWNKSATFTGIPAMAPVVLLFLFTALAGLPIFRRLGLTRRELFTIYSVLLVGGPLVSKSILGFMLVKSIHYHYFASVYRDWQNTFVPQVPLWFAPTDPAVVESFFLGESAVPWSHWWVPLGAWSAFTVAVFVCAFCTIVLLQRQWITHERLSFPFAQVPLELVREAGGEGAPSRPVLPRAWLFWGGLLISFGLTTIGQVSEHIPAVPPINLGPIILIQESKVGPIAGMGQLVLWLFPWMIAVAYLIPKDLSFSAWFFYWALVGITVAGIALGGDPGPVADNWWTTFPAPKWQGGGAIFALGLWSLWIARRHLGQAFRSLLPGRPRADDAEEPLSYRFATAGLLLSFLGLVYFCWAAGCRLWFGLALIGGIVGYHVVWARLRAETGLGFLIFPLQLQFIPRIPFGTAAYRVKEWVTTISARWAYTPGGGSSFDVCAGNALETFKIADSAQMNKRRLSWVLLLGFVVALVVGIFVLLTGIYHYGWFGLEAYASGALARDAIRDGGRISFRLVTPWPPDPRGMTAMGVGAVFAVFLGMMRLRLWWWPFHPIGYMAATCWGMYWYWSAFLIGWAAKTVVLRYGGLRLYRATVPLAIGFIVGELLNRALWAFIALVTRGEI